MSRTYYYSRVNKYGRRNNAKSIKFIAIAAILITAIYMLSLSIEPELHTVERVINDQVEQIYDLHPSE